MAAEVNWYWLALAFCALFRSIPCTSHGAQSTNSNITDVGDDVNPTLHKSSIVKDNVTLVADSELSASERTRRLLPYMAFYVPVQDLSINQQYAPVPTTNQAVRPSAAGAAIPLLSLPPQYGHTKMSSPSGQDVGPASAVYAPSASAAGVGPHYQPSAGDVYHTLHTYGGPHQQPYHTSSFQTLPAAIKQINSNGNQKYPGQHLLLSPGPPGPSSSSNVNLAGGKIKPIRQKTVQHFPPLSSQSTATSASASAYAGTTPTKQKHLVAAYRPRSKQSKINLTPFTPSNSVPGHFVPIVYTPVSGNINNNNNNNNNHIVLTSHATASSQDETVTRLNKDEKQQHFPIEYSVPFPHDPTPSPSHGIDGAVPHQHLQQPHHNQPQHQPSAPQSLASSTPDSDQTHLHHQHQHNPNNHQAQYFSAAKGGASSLQHQQISSSPSIYQHQHPHPHHPEHVAIEAFPRPPQHIALVGLKEKQTATQQRYRTKITQFHPSEPANFFDAELQQPPSQQYHYIDQHNPHYRGKQSEVSSLTSPQEQQQSHAAKYRDRIKQQVQHHQPAHIFVLSSTVSPQLTPGNALVPTNPLHNLQYSPQYPQHSPKHHSLYERPDVGSVQKLSAQGEAHNADASSSSKQSQLQFGEQILTIPVRTLFTDLRNIPHSHYSPSPSSSPTPPQSPPLPPLLSPHSLAYPKLNGAATPQHLEYPVEEPRQSLDDDQSDAHRKQENTLKPTLGPPTHAYIIVTTAAPAIHQPSTYENYGSTLRPSYKNRGNVRLQPVKKEKNFNYPAIRQPQANEEHVVPITPVPIPMDDDSAPKYVYVKEEFGQKLSTPSIKLQPLSKSEINKQVPAKQSHQLPGHYNATLQPLASRSTSKTNANAHDQITPPRLASQTPSHQRPSSIMADPNELPDIRTSSLAEILHKLQESNHLPHTLTPDNIDNSIKTLIRILNNLKQTQTIVANPPQHHETPPPSSPDYDYATSSEEQSQKEHTLQQDLNILSPAIGTNKHPGPSTGRPGIDYPNYAEIPQTSFECTQQRYKGFFGDPETNCQVWHYCDLNGGKASFLCPNGTIFSQIALTCDWWFNVKCATTAQLYVLNERLYKYILPFTPKFPEDYSGPLVDKYLAMKFQEMEDKMRLEKEKTLPEAPNEHEQQQEMSIMETEEETHADDTTEKIAEEQKSESINSHVSEQSSERNLLIDDEVDDISQRDSVDAVEGTTIATKMATSKPQELPLSLKPIVVSSTMEPDYEENERNYVKRREDQFTTSNKTEMHRQNTTIQDWTSKDSAKFVSAKDNDMNITVEKVEVIEIRPDGATGHIIRDMILNSEGE